MDQADEAHDPHSRLAVHACRMVLDYTTCYLPRCGGNVEQNDDRLNADLEGSVGTNNRSRNPAEEDCVVTGDSRRQLALDVVSFPEITRLRQQLGFEIECPHHATDALMWTRALAAGALACCCDEDAPSICRAIRQSIAAAQAQASATSVGGTGAPFLTLLRARLRLD
jgi:hypothetical protein